MKTIVRAREMAEMDRYTIDRIGIPGIVLMENAGSGIADTAIEMLAQAKGKRVWIFCGPGNNGGDGYVVARRLYRAGAEVKVFVAAPREKIHGDALTNLTIWENMGGSTLFLERLPARTPEPDLVVDALLGTGSIGKPSGLIAQVVGFINSLHVPVLAVDIPTGIQADDGSVPGEAVRATVTATMAFIKRGLLFSPGREFAGRVKVIDIGFPERVVEKFPTPVHLIEPQDIRPLLPRRSPAAYKNQVGTVVVLAGSGDFTGAAALTAEACLRAGCGLCYLCIPQSLRPILATKVTEVITWAFEDRGSGYLMAADYGSWRDRIQAQNSLAIGPGLGQHPETAALIHTILKEMQKPLVLDADGLNLCAQHTDLIANYQGEMVLTPHPGELSRLINRPIKEIINNRIDIALEAVRMLGKVVVLKGGPSVIALADGTAFINSTGNAGMATAGSGDVLTGIIAGLLAQGLSAKDAAICGVYLHGFAGDLARRQKGEMGMIASDILTQLPQALLAIERI